MSGIQGKVIAITGASSGIGEATALALAARGAHVVIGARRADRLAALAQQIEERGGRVAVKAVDVTRRGDVADFVELTRQRFGRLDALVNNAGVMPLSRMDALKVDEWDRMLDVNVRGVLHGIAAALPMMRSQGHGQIVNVSSVGGHQAVAGAAVYCATKFAVIAISEALRQEVGPDGIRVTVISPGVTISELAESISDESARAWMRDYRKIAIPAEAVARAIAYAIEQPDDVDVSEVTVRPTRG